MKLIFDAILNKSQDSVPNQDVFTDERDTELTNLPLFVITFSGKLVRKFGALTMGLIGDHPLLA